MLFAEIEAVLNPFRTQVDELEKRAGIDAATKRAREGSLFPLGIDGSEVEPDEYFADEADFTRRGIRKAYFGVVDAELRVQLIAARRALEAKHSKLLDADLPDKASEVSKAKAAVRRLPWGSGMVVALLCLGVGKYAGSGSAGTLAGALIGLFLGLGFVWNAKGTAETALEQAEADLRSVQRDRRIRKLHPETFSLQEQLTGEEDPDFGYENARANVAKFLESESAA
jgi:hypothetical protein